MKKHTLKEHHEDVEEWWGKNMEVRSMEAMGEDRRTIWFIAYERWMNDRILLTAEDGKPQPILDPYTLRNAVGRYFRVRAEHPGMNMVANLIPGTYFEEDLSRMVFIQLAADVEHSDLLARLFAGEEPLPYDEWKETHP